MPLDPAVKALLDAMAAAGAPPMETLPPALARQGFDASPLPRREVAVASVENRRIPGPAGEIPVRIYRAAASGVLPGLVYFHGGGWVLGSLDGYDATCRELCAGAGCVLVSVDYRLAPEHRYPAASEDCYAATRWVAENAAALGIDARRLAVGGDSAGGNLAAVVAQRARDAGGPPLCFQLLINPVTDCDFSRASYAENGEGHLLTLSIMRWFWDHYLPDEARRREPAASPLRAADLSGLPPALILTPEFDPLRDEGEAYGRRLKAARVATTLMRLDGLIHHFVTLGMVVPRAQAAIDEMVGALRKALAA